MSTDNEYARFISNLRDMGVAVVSFEELNLKIKEYLSNNPSWLRKAEEARMLSVAYLLFIFTVFGGLVPRKVIDLMPSYEASMLLLSELVEKTDRPDCRLIGFVASELLTEQTYLDIEAACLSDPIVSIGDALTAFNTQLNSYEISRPKRYRLTFDHLNFYLQFADSAEDIELFKHDSGVIFKALLNSISMLDMVRLLTNGNEEQHTLAVRASANIAAECELLRFHFFDS